MSRGEHVITVLQVTAGFLIGTGVTMSLSPTIASALQMTGSTVTLMVANAVIGVIAGVLLGIRLAAGRAPRRTGIPLPRGAPMWPFPQGPLLVRIALRRAGAIVGGGEE